MIDELIYPKEFNYNDQFDNAIKNYIWNERYVSVMDKFLDHPILSPISYCFLGMSAAGSLSFEDFKNRHKFNRYSTYAFHFFSVLLGAASFPHVNKNELLSRQAKQTLTTIICLQVGVALYKKYWEMGHSLLKPSAPPSESLKPIQPPPSPSNAGNLAPLTGSTFKPSKESLARFMSLVTPIQRSVSPPNNASKKSIEEESYEVINDYYLYLTKLEEYELNAFQQWHLLRNKRAKGEDIAEEINELVVNIQDKVEIFYLSQHGQRIKVASCEEKVRDYLRELIRSARKQEQPDEEIKKKERGDLLVKLNALSQMLDALQFYARVTGRDGYHPLATYFNELETQEEYFKCLEEMYPTEASFFIRKLKNLERLSKGQINGETLAILEYLDLYDLAFKKITEDNDFKDLSKIIDDIKVKIRCLRKYAYGLNIALAPNDKESLHIKDLAQTIKSQIKELYQLRNLRDLFQPFFNDTFFNDIGASPPSVATRSEHGKKILSQARTGDRALLSLSERHAKRSRANK